MAKGRITIDEGRCKGCGLCVTACQHDLIHLAEDQLNARGYHPALFVDPSSACTGCTLCAVICPDVCITVYKAHKPVISRPMVV
jgi:2-oxoglutarate ferredoxin oxidoreductase subunit delta